MHLVKSVISNENVSNLVTEHESIISDILNKNISEIISVDTSIISESIDEFIVEGNLANTYENITSFVEEDVNAFLETTSYILADSDLSLEDKKGILSNLDYSEEMAMPAGLATAKTVAATKAKALALKSAMGVSKLAGTKAAGAMGAKAGLTKVAAAMGAKAGLVGAGLGAAGVGLAGYGAYKGAKALKNYMAKKKDKTSKVLTTDVSDLVKGKVKK